MAETVKKTTKRPDIKIPDMQIKIFPTLSEEEFSMLIKDKYWLKTVVKVCENCIFNLARQSPFGGVYEDPNVEARIKFAGIGPLNPKKLKERTEKTHEKIKFDKVLTKDEVDKEPCCHGTAVATKIPYNIDFMDFKKDSTLYTDDSKEDHITTDKTQQERSKITKNNASKVQSYNQVKENASLNFGDEVGNEISSNPDFSDSEEYTPINCGIEMSEGSKNVIQIGLSQKDKSSFFFDPMDIIQKKRMITNKLKKDKLTRMAKNLEKDESSIGVNTTNIQSGLNVTSFNANNMNNYTMGDYKDSQADNTTIDNLAHTRLKDKKTMASSEQTTMMYNFFNNIQTQ